MPIYAYRCTACGHAKDVLQKISDPLRSVCPACGAAAFTKQVTAAGFQLKGSGWYVTDFRGDKQAKKPADGAEAKDAPAAKPVAEGAGEKPAADAPKAGAGEAAKPAAASASASPAPAPAAPSGPPAGSAGS
jgi:putative FmdB family regulatory protein